MPTLPEELELRVNADTTGLDRSMRGAARTVQTFSRRAGRAMDQMARKTALAGAALATGYVAAFRQAATAADQLRNASRSLNVPVRDLQSMHLAARRLGLEAKNVEKTLLFLPAKIQDAVREHERGLDGTYTATLRNIGLTVDDLVGRTAQAQVEIVAAAISSTDDLNAAAKASNLLFGRLGTRAGEFAQAYIDAGRDIRESGIGLTAQDLDQLSRGASTIAGLRSALQTGLIRGFGAANIELGDSADLMRAVSQTVSTLIQSVTRLGQILYEHRAIVIAVAGAWVVLRTGLLLGTAIPAVIAGVAALGKALFTAASAAAAFAAPVAIVAAKILGLSALLAGLVAGLYAAVNLIQDTSDAMRQFGGAIIDRVAAKFDLLANSARLAFALVQQSVLAAIAKIADTINRLPGVDIDLSGLARSAAEATAKVRELSAAQIEARRNFAAANAQIVAEGANVAREAADSLRDSGSDMVAAVESVIDMIGSIPGLAADFGAEQIARLRDYVTSAVSSAAQGAAQAAEPTVFRNPAYFDRASPASAAADIAEIDEETRTRISRLGEDIQRDFTSSLSLAFQQGDFSGLGRSLVANLNRTFSEAFASQAVSALFSRLASQFQGGFLGSLFGVLGGGGGAPRFHAGGVVPGRAGQEVPAILQAGEQVIPIGGGRPVQQIVINATGDVTAATERALRRSGRNIALQSLAAGAASRG